MKRLEDIERLSMADLERIASDDSIKVPDTLKRDITITARALEMASQEEAAEKKAQVSHRRYRKILKDLAWLIWSG